MKISTNTLLLFLLIFGVLNAATSSNQKNSHLLGRSRRTLGHFPHSRAKYIEEWIGTPLNTNEKRFYNWLKTQHIKNRQVRASSPVAKVICFPNRGCIDLSDAGIHP